MRWDHRPRQERGDEDETESKHEQAAVGEGSLDERRVGLLLRRRALGRDQRAGRATAFLGDRLRDRARPVRVVEEATAVRNEWSDHEREPTEEDGQRHEPDCGVSPGDPLRGAPDG